MASAGVPRIFTPARSERHRQAQRRLTAELHDHAVGLLDVDDGHHVFERERLEVQAIGGVVVGRDRLGIAVDHDGLEPELAQRERRVHAAVVELDALADAVRTAAEDHDLLVVGGTRFRLVAPGRVHVRRERLELGGAAVDAREDRASRRPPGAPCARSAASRPVSWPIVASEKPISLARRKASTGIGCAREAP